MSSGTLMICCFIVLGVSYFFSDRKILIDIMMYLMMLK